MSVQALSWVLEESQSEGIDRLVLLIMANHANQDEWLAWPSVRTIAREARISTNTVVAALRRLVAAGELELVRQGSRSSSSRYRFTRTPARVGVADTRHLEPDTCRDGVAKVSRPSRDTGVAKVSRLERDRTKNHEPRTAAAYSLERVESTLPRAELAKRARDAGAALRRSRLAAVPTEEIA